MFVLLSSVRIMTNRMTIPFPLWQSSANLALAMLHQPLSASATCATNRSRKTLVVLSINSEFLELLRCPVTGERLSLATPEQVDRLEAARQSGTLRIGAERSQLALDQPIEAALIGKETGVSYPVQGGVPLLLPDHAIHADRK